MRGCLCERVSVREGVCARGCLCERVSVCEGVCVRGVFACSFLIFFIYV